MKRYAAALFDIDGTLIDLDAVVKGVNKALEKNGYSKLPEEKIVKEMIGYPLVKTLPDLINVDEEEAKKISKDYTDYYLDHHEESDPYPGVGKTLKKLREEGLKIGLVTTKKRSEALSTIKTYPEIIYDVLIGGDDVENVKPDPEPIERACKELEVSVKEVLYIGDHKVDIETGENAGCDTVGVTTGVHGREELEEAGAGDIIDKIEEVVPIALSEAEEVRENLKIPKDRVGALIGKGGETKKKLEKKAKVKLDINSKTGELTLTRFIGRAPEKSIKASNVVRAIGNGFPPRKAFKLLEPKIYIKTLDLRDQVGHSNKKIKQTKSRIIGKKGKARRTLEELTGTDISIKGKKVSAIGGIPEVKLARRGIEKIIEGAPHGAVYKDLEEKRKKLIS